MKTTLDFATLSTDDLKCFFAEKQPKHNAGYGHYESSLQKDLATPMKKLFERLNITNDMKVLEIGGYRGHRAIPAIEELGFNDWTILDIYDSPLKLEHENLNYIFGDVKKMDLEQTDLIISFRFLNYFEKQPLDNLIKKMNSSAKRQLHIIQTAGNPDFCNTEHIDWWAKQKFSNGSAVISLSDFEHSNFEGLRIV